MMTLKKSIADKRVLVTGAGGFIGSHLCARLSEAGAKVHGISRRPESHSQSGITWWQGDVADHAVLRDIFNAVRPQFIFHLASVVTGSRDAEAVLLTFRNNLESTVNILTLAAGADCERVVLTGSLEEPEDAESAPCSPYAAAKWASGGYARMFHALYNVPVVTARVFMTYGAAQRDLQKVIPYVMLSFLQGEAPRLSSGQRPVDWIYVSDVVDGLVAAATAPSVEGCTLDLGSGELVTIRTVVEKLAQLVRSPVAPLFGALPDRPAERVRAANVQRTYEMIGWAPKISLEEGLRKTIDWYRDALEKSPAQMSMVNASHDPIRGVART